jgi:hypothetical protein
MANCTTTSCNPNEVCCSWLLPSNGLPATYCCGSDDECAEGGRCEPKLNSREKIIKIGVIVLIVLAGIVIVTCIGAFVYQCWQKYRGKRYPDSETQYRDPRSASPPNDPTDIPPTVSIAPRAVASAPPVRARTASAHSLGRVGDTDDEAEISRRELPSRDSPRSRHGAASCSPGPQHEMSEAEYSRKR